MITGIRNARLVMPDGVRAGQALYFENGVITAITGSEHPCDTEIDAQGLYLAPGFVDIHSHGGGGADFLDGTADAFVQAAALHARHGTTTIVPTATSGTCEETLAMLTVFQDAKAHNTHGADMPGVHLEGPYFAMERRGAQDPRFVRDPSPEEYLRILDAGKDILRWSAAPELPGTLDFARELKRRGILASIGHSDANYDQVLKALETGYTHITHLYSCTSTVHRINALRQAGSVESAYLLDGLTVEIIADGIHLPPPLLQFVYRFKGPDKTALVTDSMRGAGMPEGLSVLGSLTNGQQVRLEDGVAKLMDRSALAGSTATMDRLVRNMIRLAGATLSDAVKMAAATPAAIMGFRDRGRLETGLRADLVLFDEDLAVKRTIVAGTTVFCGQT